MISSSRSTLYRFLSLYAALYAGFGVYFSTPYYVYPDGGMALETFRVIGAAMAEARVVGIGRVTLSRRERPVMVEPRGAGMALIKLSLAEPSYPCYFVMEVADGPIGLHTRKKENVPCRFARLNSNVLHCFWC